MASRKISIELDFQAKNLNQITKQLSDVVNLIDKKSMSVGIDPASVSKLKSDTATLAKAITNAFNTNTGRINWKSVNESLYKSKIDVKQLDTEFKKLGVDGTAAFNKIRTAGLNFNEQLKDTTSWLSKLGTTLTNTLRWRVSNAALNALSGQLQSAYYFARDLDESLTNIRIVSGITNDQSLEFAKRANEAAKAMKTGTLDYTNAALIYYQQGMNTKDVEAMTKATLIGANITGESAQEMSTLYTAVMRGYDLNADKAMMVADKLAAVGATTAADFYELATAMSKVASIANTAGVSIDEVNAQIATVVSTTKEAPEIVGNALKSMYSRMLRFKSDTKGIMADEMGEAFSAPAVENALQAFSKGQISLFKTAEDGTQTLRDMGSVIEDVGNAWETAGSQEAKMSLATALGGTYHLNRVMALFNSWDQYKETVTISLNAEGTALKQNDIYLQSYAGSVAHLQATLEDLFMTFTESDVMIGIVNALADFLDITNNIVKSMGGLPSILMAVGAIIGRSVFQKPLVALSMSGKVIPGQDPESAMGSNTRVAAIKSVSSPEEFAKIKAYSDKLDEQVISLDKQNKILESINKEFNKLRGIASELDTTLENTSFKNLDSDINMLKRQLRILEKAGELNFDAKNISDIEKVKEAIANLEKSTSTNFDKMKNKAQDAMDVMLKSVESGRVRKVKRRTGARGATMPELEEEISGGLKSARRARQDLDEYGKSAEEAIKKTQRMQNAIMNSVMVFGSLAAVWSNEDTPALEKVGQTFGAIATTAIMNTDKIAEGMSAAFSGNNSLSKIFANMGAELINVQNKTNGLGKSLEKASGVGGKSWAGLTGTFRSIGGGLQSMGVIGKNAFTVLSLGAKGLAASLAPILIELLPIVAAFAIFEGVRRLIDYAITTNEEYAESFEKVKSAAEEAAATEANTLAELEKVREDLKNQEELGTNANQEKIDKLLEQEKVLQAQLATEKLITIEKNKQSAEEAVRSATGVKIESKYKISVSAAEYGYFIPEMVTNQEELNLAVEKYKTLQGQLAVATDPKQIADLNKQMSETATYAATLSQSVRANTSAVTKDSNAYKNLSDEQKAQMDISYESIANYDAMAPIMLDNINNTNASTDAIVANTKATRDNAESISALSAIDKDLSVFSKAMEEFADTGSISVETLAGFNEKIQGTESFEEFSRLAMSGSATLDQLSASMNNVVSEYLATSDGLKLINDGNKQAIENQLKLMGVTNAAEVASRALTKAKYDEAAVSINLNTASVTEINNLLALAKSAGLAQEGIDALTQASMLASNREKGLISEEYYNREMGRIKSVLNNAVATFDLGAVFKPPKTDTKSTTDKWKEKFDSDLADLKYSFDKGVINAEEYYKSLQVLNEKYFAKGKNGKYKDEYRQYELEVLNGLREEYKKQYEDRLAISQDWISRQKEYGKLTAEQEIAAWERVKKYTKKYYEDAIKEAGTNKVLRLELEKEFAEKKKEFDDNILKANQEIYKRDLELLDNNIENQKFYDQITLDNHLDLLNQRRALLEDALARELITYEEYSKAVVENDKKIYEAKKEAIEKERDDLEKLVGAVEWYADTKIKALEDEKALLESKNKATKEEIQLEQLKEALANAKAQRTKRVYYQDRGWVWEADQKAIADAQAALDEFNFQKQLDAIDEQINKWEEYKEQWQLVTETYKVEQNKLILEQQLGAEWENELLNQRTTRIKEFATAYSDTYARIIALQKEFNSLINQQGGSIGSYSGDGIDRSKVKNYNGVNYESSIDYSAAIAKAKKQGAPVDEVYRLERAREAKIYGDKMTQYYADGGVADYTGPAQLHGRPNAVETIFNATDGKKLFDFINKIPNIADYVAGKFLQSIPSNYFNPASSSLNNNMGTNLSISNMTVYTPDANDFMRQMKNLVAITGNNG